MSECVVRMEMPKSCYNCDLRYECNAFYAPGKPKPFMKGCRIVCQLPEGHGRLVDASYVIDVMQDELDNDVPITVDDCFQIGCKIPTIVPAEAEMSETCLD